MSPAMADRTDPLSSLDALPDALRIRSRKLVGTIASQVALERVAARLVEAGHVDYQRGDGADQLARANSWRVGERVEAA